MRIWHAGTLGHDITDGLSTTLRVLVGEQVRAGHDVVILQNAREVVPWADPAVRTLSLPRDAVVTPRAVRALLAAEPPDVVHFHSVFLPSHTTLAVELWARSIPWVVKPGGGLAPGVLARHSRLQSAYRRLVEAPFLRHAAGLALVTAEELQWVRAGVGEIGGVVRVIPNPVEADRLGPGGWRGDVSARRAVFLGRFDVVHKGIDRLGRLVAAVRGLTVDAYGVPPARGQEESAAVVASAPAGCRFLPPVYGVAKADVLRRASFLLHPARWEAFGVAVAEALWLGVPVVLGEGASLARPLASAGAAIILPVDDREAATVLESALADPLKLGAIAERGQALARAELAPSKAARRYEELYAAARKA